MRKNRCLIADLVVDVPAAGGLASRCAEYITPDAREPDIVIKEEKYHPEKYNPATKEDMIAYMESARQFLSWLLLYDGFYLHASAVVLDGMAYLFSGTSGAGKSTHARQWQQIFGEKVCIINDDKPALRFINGTWFAYGTPWCGKDGINVNAKAPVAGVCFLKKGSENQIRRMSKEEALQSILSQTIYKFNDAEHLDLLLNTLNCFLRDIPVFELENRPEPAAAELSYATMKRIALEAGV